MLLLPSKCIISPALTVWSEPALAIGGMFGGGIYLIVTLVSSESTAFLSSLTVNSNIKFVLADILDGAVNVARDEFAFSNLTLGPAVCFHAYVNSL